ncbi:Protein kinase-like domain [Cordyceps javanica]|uniref:Protein kinase-like domain n=1 Tax=Cordyceps javanica TaxID=43265 RepID=A0A545VJS5_9HYPO|nr:Protein kinase-like domain [Cordyceps javanica]TQW01987.1 Protein kinase-like domain [Cordyceps javanica]
MWEQKGKPSADTESSDEGEVEDDIEPGAIFLCKSVMRKVLLRPDKTVVKSGPFISLGEAEALKVAPGAGLPVPSLYGVSSTNGTVEIRMSYIQGQTLEELWPSMSGEQRKNVAGQLHEIVKRMRELEPPPDCIGCCDGTGIRDTRIPSTLRASFRSQLRADHRIVFTHGDLTPRNIMMQDGKISGILDWEESGWYPEYWELAKFFERFAEGDWKEYADIIFPRPYHIEMVTYTAMSKWRNG